MSDFLNKKILDQKRLINNIKNIRIQIIKLQNYYDIASKELTLVSWEIKNYHPPLKRDEKLWNETKKELENLF